MECFVQLVALKVKSHTCHLPLVLLPELLTPFLQKFTAVVASSLDLSFPCVSFSRLPVILQAAPSGCSWRPLLDLKGNIPPLSDGKRGETRKLLVSLFIILLDGREVFCVLLKHIYHSAQFKLEWCECSMLLIVILLIRNGPQHWHWAGSLD